MIKMCSKGISKLKKKGKKKQKKGGRTKRYISASFMPAKCNI